MGDSKRRAITVKYLKNVIPPILFSAVREWWWWCYLPFFHTINRTYEHRTHTRHVYLTCCVCLCRIHPLDTKHAFKIGLSIRLSSEAKMERIMYWPRRGVGEFINIMICVYIYFVISQIVATKMSLGVNTWKREWQGVNMRKRVCHTVYT